MSWTLVVLVPDGGKKVVIFVRLVISNLGLVRLGRRKNEVSGMKMKGKET